MTMHLNKLYNQKYYNVSSKVTLNKLQSCIFSCNESEALILATKEACNHLTAVSDKFTAVPFFCSD